MVRIRENGKEILEKEILESELHEFVEKNSEVLLNAFLIKSKFNFEGYHGFSGGELDSLMLDKDSLRPVIVEYKKGKLDRNTTAINQTIYYYDWIKDHQSKMNNYILSRISEKGYEVEGESINEINWKEDIRCIIIAKEFSDWDKVLLEYLNINIELYTYCYYEDNSFDLKPAVDLQDKIKKEKRSKSSGKGKGVLGESDAKVKDLVLISKFNATPEFIKKWENDFQIRGTKYYVAVMNPIDNSTIVRLYIRKTEKLKITMIPLLPVEDLRERFPDFNIRKEKSSHDLPIVITEITSEEEVNSILNLISEGLEGYLETK